MRLGDQEFFLNESQAHVLRILHHAAEQGTPDVGQQALLAEIESDANRLRDLFRDSPAWNTLIVPAKTKGAFGLNL